MDLRTQYLGLTLKNPIVASASPLSRTIDGIRRLDAAGVSAIVLYSLFAEQIARDAAPRGSQPGTFADALRHFPAWETYAVGPDEYLDLISLARRSVSVPIIASLNGSTAGEWTEWAARIADAGADALELNLYHIPTEIERTSAEVEQQYIDTVAAVKRRIAIPLAVKIGPIFTVLPNFAHRLTDAGANGLVLFNRFLQPDFDLETRTATYHATLSTASDLLLPLRWIALLFGRVSIDLALTGGVHGHEDVLKSVLAGARVVEVASEMIDKGPDRVAEILAAMRDWMTRHDCETLADLCGAMSLVSVTDPAAFERAGYARVLESIGASPQTPIL